MINLWIFKKKFAGAYDRDAYMYIKSKFEKSLKEFKSNWSNIIILNIESIPGRVNKCADRFKAQQLRDLISRGTKSLVK